MIQPFLLPPSLRDWLPEDEMAWFILDLVDRIDLSDFYKRYRDDGQGNALYDPKTMVAIFDLCLLPWRTIQPEN